MGGKKEEITKTDLTVGIQVVTPVVTGVRRWFPKGPCKGEKIGKGYAAIPVKVPHFV